MQDELLNLSEINQLVESEEMDSDNETSVLISTHTSIPRDRLKLVYIIFYLLGIASLLPYNFFITASDYFNYKFRNASLTDPKIYEDPKYRTELQNTFENYFVIAATIPNIVFNLFNTLATKWIPIRIRLVSSLCVMLFMFTGTVILVKINTDDWQLAFFVITISTVVLINAASAILQGGMFGLAAMFPGKYTQAIMSGQGMGGTFAALASILSILIAGNQTDSALGYFLSALLVLIAALVAYLYLRRVDFAKHHIHLHSQLLETINDSTLSSSGSKPSLLIILKEIWWLGLSVAFIFLVTLSCFPAVTSHVVSLSESDGSMITGELYVPLSCFLLFNVGDLLGRTAAGFLQMPASILPLASLLRVGFVPLFLYCNVQSRYLPMVFNSDAYFIVFMSLFAFTNGYFGTLCMMKAPERVPREHVETAGAMMSFFLTTGLGSGSLLSLVLVKLFLHK